MSKYVERILKTKEESDKALAPARAKQQEAAIGIAVAELDLEVQTQQARLEDLKSGFPLDVDSIIDAQDELALNTRRLSQLKGLVTELFGS